MFCPVCGIEYRPGFTRCNDCDVDLVDELPSEEDQDQAAATNAGGADSPALLWRGPSGGDFSEITLALEAAGIPYNREKLDPRLIFAGGSAPLEIWVPHERLDAAQKVLDDVFARAGQSETAAAAQPELADEDDGSLPEPAAPAEELHPEDATAEVWSGADEGVAQFLKSCLLTNGIGCYLDGQESGKQSLRVRPEDDARSREIVKQVVEGEPPE